MAELGTVLVYFGLLLIVASACGALAERFLDRRERRLPDAFTAEERARYAAKQDLWGSTVEGEPSDDEIYNGYGREGGIAYDREPGMDEHDWRL